jgi:hypothetical protein
MRHLQWIRKGQFQVLCYHRHLVPPRLLLLVILALLLALLLVQVALPLLRLAVLLLLVQVALLLLLRLVDKGVINLNN